MTPSEQLVAVRDDESAERALELMAKHEVDQLPVVCGRRCWSAWCAVPTC